MSKAYVIGNWKANLSLTASVALARAVASGTSSSVLVVLCPSFPSLSAVGAVLEGTAVSLGAQDVSDKEAGAHTGEVIAPLLHELGCRYVIVGHSERRHSGETSAIIKRKLIAALKHDLVPVLCIGETQEERRCGLRDTVLQKQLQDALIGVDFGQSMFMVAYEPVWAIGSGETVSTADTKIVGHEIRELLNALFGNLFTQDHCRVIYGGSVTAADAHSFVGRDLMDGVLVGTSSLVAGEFLDIINKVAAHTRWFDQ